MTGIEIGFILIGLPIVGLVAWLVDRKDKWEDLEYFDDEEL
jgi:hypothetical protein